ncbi:hypothetical protein GOBAR_DD25940 [Gossypium barbadense]|nr:hypothetical protein GOBAR_DD25940 [Gossypium barbadense]
MLISEGGGHAYSNRCSRRGTLRAEGAVGGGHAAADAAGEGTVRGGRLRNDRQMEVFRTVLEDCDLVDLGYTGRCLSHIDNTISDHCPLLLNTELSSGSGTSSRRRKNKIIGLKDADGSMKDNEDDLMRIATDYFKGLFSSEGCKGARGIFEGVQKTITEEINSRLLENFRAEEISKAVMEMGGTKAPGFDGFQAVFFQKFWAIVGEDVTKFCIGVLNRKDSLNEKAMQTGLFKGARVYRGGPRENRIWKEELISSLFSNKEVEAIKCIPLSKTRCEDCQVWRGEKTGQYTAKYFLIEGLETLQFTLDAIWVQNLCYMWSQNFIYLVQHKEERIWEKVVIAIWAIWWARNKQVMEGISITKQSSIEKILSMVEELRVLNEKLPVIKAVGSD